MTKSQTHILVVDDEESICQLLEIMLSEEGFWVATAGGYDEAMKHLQNESFELVIADIMMPDADGLALLRDIKQFDPDIQVILITAYASLSSAVEALRHGAFDYITKPFQMDQIKFAVRKALETGALRRENRILRRTIRNESALDRFIGTSKSVQEIRELVRKIALTESAVLITGESGTGKELLAQAIHELSDRANGPFITINCAALPETLLESELFGYMKGAFTGANKDKDGLIKVANNGTFFLDEVGETSPAIQAKLLRILETNEFTPLGAIKSEKVDIRLIAATNRDLKKMVSYKKFRKDLFYRLNVLRIHIPPLRERSKDILPIANSALQSLALRSKSEPKTISSKALEIMTKFVWEGNVRELENVIERAVLLCDGDTIIPEHLPAYIKEAKENILVEDEYESAVAAQPAMQKIIPITEIEKAYIFWALTQTDFNKSEAARLLGIDLSTLYRKIEKYDLKKFMSKE